MLVKYGGNAMKSLDLRRAVALEIAELRKKMLVVVVHGGGPVIEQELAARKVKSEFMGGLRVTSPEAMEVVEMALCKLNKQLSQDIGGAVGLMGRDSNLLQADIIRPDLGRVGGISRVNVELINALLGAGITPVIGSVAVAPDGEALNVNADTAAGKVAGALGMGIIFLTDVDGVYRNYPDPKSLAATMSRAEVVSGVEEGWIQGGMIPKVQAALDALDSGSPHATIASGMQAGVLTKAAFAGAGTRITP